MTAAATADTARLPLLLSELRLPTIARLWPDFAARADKEGWPAARLLTALADLELAERARRRIERHLAEARLPPGKTLATFDFAAVPTLSKAHVTALAAGTGWLEKGANPTIIPTPRRFRVILIDARRHPDCRATCGATSAPACILSRLCGGPLG